MPEKLRQRDLNVMIISKELLPYVVYGVQLAQLGKEASIGNVRSDPSPALDASGPVVAPVVHASCAGIKCCLRRSYFHATKELNLVWRSTSWRHRCCRPSSCPAPASRRSSWGTRWTAALSTWDRRCTPSGTSRPSSAIAVSCQRQTNPEIHVLCFIRGSL